MALSRREVEVEPVDTCQSLTPIFRPERIRLLWAQVGRLRHLRATRESTAITGTRHAWGTSMLQVAEGEQVSRVAQQGNSIQLVD